MTEDKKTIDRMTVTTADNIKLTIEGDVEYVKIKQKGDLI